MKYTTFVISFNLDDKKTTQIYYLNAITFSITLYPVLIKIRIHIFYLKTNNKIKNQILETKQMKQNQTSKLEEKTQNTKQKIPFRSQDNV